MNCSKPTDPSQIPSLTWLSKVREPSLSPPSAADCRRSASLQCSIQPLGLSCLLLQAASSQASRAHKWGEAEALVTASVPKSTGQTLLGSALRVRMLFPWPSPALFCQEEFPAIWPLCKYNTARLCYTGVPCFLKI